MPEGVTIFIGSALMILGPFAAEAPFIILRRTGLNISVLGMRFADWGIGAENGGVLGVRLIMERSVIDHRAFA